MEIFQEEKETAQEDGEESWWEQRGWSVGHRRLQQTVGQHSPPMSPGPQAAFHRTATMGPLPSTNRKSPSKASSLTFLVNPGWGCADKGNTQDLKTQVRKSYLQAKRVRDPSEWSAQALVFSRDVWCASTLSSWKQINSNCDPVKVCFSGESWNMPAASINKQRYLWTLNISAIFSKHTHLLGDES